MIELVVYIIIVNLIFECLQMLCPDSKMSGFVRSFLAIIIIFLICLKIKSYF